MNHLLAVAADQGPSSRRKATASAAASSIVAFASSTVESYEGWGCSHIHWLGEQRVGSELGGSWPSEG